MYSTLLYPALPTPHFASKFDPTITKLDNINLVLHFPRNVDADRLLPFPPNLLINKTSPTTPKTLITPTVVLISKYRHSPKMTPEKKIINS